MATRESIIEDSRKLSVKVNQILAYDPTDKKLKDMRDGLMRLNKKHLRTFYVSISVITFRVVDCRALLLAFALRGLLSGLATSHGTPELISPSPAEQASLFDDRNQ